MKARDYSEDIAISAGQNIKERDYWLDKLSGELVRHGFPYDVERTAAAQKERSIETVKFVFPGELYAKLMKLRSGSDPRLYMILTAGLIVLLDKYTYNRNKWNKDIIVGTPVVKQEVEGEFINTVLALRNRLDDHMTFKELLLQVRQTIIEAAENQNYPIETLLYKLNIPDSRDDFPLFDIAVLLENIHDKGYLGDIKLSMVFSFSRTGETVEGELEYNASLYKKETAARIINHLENLLQEACFDVNVRLSDIDILSPEEKEQLLFAFNDNRVEFAGEKTVHRFIEEYAEKTPDRAAVVCHDDTYTLTYGELNRRAGRLARILRDNGICREQPVGILLHRSFAMVESILAAWKAGGAYIPIDPAYPVQRIGGILADSTAPVLITQSRHIEPGLANLYRGKIIRLDCRTGEKENRPAGNLDLPVNAHSLAYVIYTSGSTGKPKGAMVEHIGMMNHIRAKIDDLQITAESIVAQNSSHTFDISVWQFFTALVKGGKTVIYTNELVLDTEGFIARIIKDKITILEVVPSYLAVMLENLPISLPLPLDYLMVTGETVKPGLVRKWFERYPGIKMVNAYGPTEASDDITHHIMNKAPDLERVPIGKSLQNFNIYIVDENMKLSPIGVKGEIYVSGLGVGRGYLNNPELTAEKFLYFSYKKVYRTGDLGRWLPDGTIDFFGRKDYQVKIRGYRIELGEIESKLVNHPQVKEAVVIDKEVGGHKYLCAFLVVDGASRLDVTGIKDYLSGSLPAYMVPAYFVRLEKMPLTANGKIDRKALPEPEITGAAEEYIPPGNEMEEKLADIWGEVLQVDKERIGIDANFFEFGGHSLRATVLVSRLHKEFNVKVPLAEVFKTPTIRELAGYLKRSAQDKYSSIEPAVKKDYYALSPAQKRLYVLQQMDLESIGYNVPGIVEFEEKPDKERLENALEELVRRHESLRTSFVVIDDEPVQEINDVRELELGIEYYEAIDKRDIEKIIRDFVRPFDPGKSPLLRVGLINSQNEINLLMVDVHHIAADGVSHDILVRDFISLYLGKELPRLRLQYKDFSEWQNREKAKDEIKQQEAYWLKEFEGEIPILNLPIDYSRPVLQDFAGSTINFKIPVEETGALNRMALEQGVTLYMVLLAVYNIFLSKVSSQDAVVVGTPTAGRRHGDLEQIIGMFVNTLALVNEPVGEKIFAGFLKEVKEKTLAAFENQDYPFEELVDRVTVSRDTSRNPIFDVMFVLQNMGNPEAELAELKLKPYEYKNRISKFDLTLNALETEKNLVLSFEYSTKLFRKETIERFITYFETIVSSIIKEPLQRISGIEIMSREEKQKILYNFNDNKAGYPLNKTIHGLFEDQAARTSDGVAVVCVGRRAESGEQIVGAQGTVPVPMDHVSITYSELNKKSNQFAGVLREKGVLADDIVGIKMEPSIEMITGILGILKSGGAYLPIDPDCPRERIDYMLKDSNARVLVKSVGNRLACSDSQSSSPSNPSGLAYIIYTSGSTGLPKGVMVNHQPVINLLYYLDGEYPFEKTDTYLLKTSYIFDVSVTELFGWFLNGGRLALLPRNDEKDPLKILDAIARYYVTHINFVPSMFNAFVETLDMDAQSIDLLSSLKYIFLAGEALKPELVNRFRRINSRIPLEDLYGPTEAAVYASKYSLSDWGGDSDIPIGKSVQNVQLYILDRAECFQPIGISGELCIGGEGLARGYLNRPELTAEKFFFFSSKKIYKTGDLARWLPDGNIEFLGRIDNQVKIRGYRIELGEIESHLQKHEDIKEAVVLVREENGDKYLCAYIVSDRDLTSSLPELRECLVRELPVYMIPAFFVQLEKIPLTPSGKVDRKALPGHEAAAAVGEYTAPRDELERKLAEIWGEVLQVKARIIGIDANFFRLGGHSLKATVLAVKIHKELSVKLSLGELFKTPTIRGLSGCIKGRYAYEYTSIEPAPAKEYYKLSSAQKRLYVLQQMEIESTGYNLPLVVMVEGEVDREKFSGTFRQLINRHESLRTSFEIIEEEPVQKVHGAVEFEIRYSESREVETVIRDFIRPFDLSHAPLMRIGLLSLEENKYLLMIDMHHIITDAISLEIFIEEFMALYQGRSLPQSRLQYKDYSEWQNRNRESEEIKRQEKYWVKQFEEKIPVLDLPLDYARPAVQGFTGRSINFGIGEEEAKALRALAMEEKATLYMVLLAIFNILLSKLSGQEEIVVGTPTAGRRHAEIQQVIGMFVNTLALVNYPEGSKTFREFLGEVKERSLSAFENQEYQFEDLVEKVAVNRDVSRNALFDVMFALQNMSTAEIGIGTPGKRLKVTPYDYENRVSKFDMTLTAMEIGEGLAFTVDYRIDLFKKETIERFTYYFKHIVSVILRGPIVKISKIEIIPEKEKQEILYDFNDTEVGYAGEKTIHEMFEEQAVRMPDSVAVVCAAQRQITYGELSRKSHRLAVVLREKGVLADDIVGIKVEPSIEMIIGIMGILKADGAYLPIDPDYPQERIDYMLKDSNAALLLTSEELSDVGRGKRYFAPTTCNLHLSLAYIIYTSGTTGKPKGVMLTHGNLVNYVSWFTGAAGLTGKDKTLLCSSFVFDLGYTSIYSSILSGAELHIVPRETYLLPEQLLNYTRANGISYLKITPSLFAAVVDSPGFSKENCGTLRLIVLGGEAINVNDVERAHRVCSHIKIMNHYGPTETTIGSVARFIDFSRLEDYKKRPAIGKPIHNTRVYIMDKYMKPIPRGVTGELCIAGDGVGRGYLNKPGLTSEKFLFFSYKSYRTYRTYSSKRIYKTGDLGRWLAGGDIEFLGRIDHQVKVRGFRIELGEIEACLLKHKELKNAVVVVVEAAGSKSLCAYIVSDDVLDIHQLREYLKVELPGYMVPSYFVRLEKIKLTPNGKIDRRALPLPDEAVPVSGEEYAAPGNEIEEKLVETWKSVLGREVIGITDDFFMIGGDSIKCIQVISRMMKAGYRVEMADIFRYPTISRLASQVKRTERFADQSAVTGAVPLTPIQEAFFLETPVDPHHYNQAVMLYSPQGFEVEAVEAVFTGIQAHHDALRMTFREEGGRIIQVNRGLEHSLSLEVYHLQDHDHERAVEIIETRANELQASIDLEKGPLMKLGLFRLDDGDRLLIIIHHLVVDGVSWRILLEDMDNLYSQYREHRQTARLKLPPKTDSFKFWSEKLSEYADSRAFLKEKAYWRELESWEVQEIKKDFAGESNYVKDTGNVSFSLTEEETDSLLTKANHAFGTEINDILLTALGMAVREVFGIEKLAIALEGHGRENILEDMDVTRTMGWFTGIYPVVLDFSRYPGPGGMARQIKEIKEVLHRVPDKGIGYGILKYLTAKEHKEDIDIKLKPQIRFNYLGQLDAGMGQMFFEAAKESVGHAQSLHGRRKYELEVSGMITGKRLRMSIEYNTKQYKPGTVEALVHRYKKELCFIISFCCAREKREPTPCDFTYNKLSIEAVDTINAGIRGEIEDIYSLTPMQEWMLFYASYNEHSSAYFEQVSYRLRGSLDAAAVEKSINELFKRYDVLRAVFFHENFESPVQVIMKERRVEFLYEDICERFNTGAEREAFVKEFRQKDRKRSFDLSRDVLMRAAVFRVNVSEYEFTWSHHHILMDGWCTGILIGEFFEIYHSYMENRVYRLPAVNRFRDYIEWLENRDKNESRTYWRDYLAGYEELASLPKVGASISSNLEYKSETVRLTLGTEKTRQLDRLAAGNHVTLNTVLLAAWGILLAKYNDRRDVVFSSVVSGRPAELAGVDTMVGLFINTVPVRVRYEENTTFKRLLRQVQEEALASEPYHHISLAEIQAQSRLKQHLSDINVVFDNYPAEGQLQGMADGTFVVSDIEAFEQSEFNFGLLIASGDELIIRFFYNGNMYEEELVERIASQFDRILQQVLVDEKINIEEVTLLSESETTEISSELKKTREDIHVEFDI